MKNEKKAIETSKNCRYCGNTYTKKDGEHVFPYGLGGENLFMDCVCDKCNNYFSGLELELYQKSFVGLLRSTMGVEGYSPNERNPAPFKAPFLLSFDEKNQIVLEMGQYFKMQVFVRPQIFALDGKFYAEADTLKNKQLFTDAFVKWKINNAIFTVREGGQIVHVKFHLAEGHYSVIRESAKSKIKNPIQYCSLPDNHHLYSHLRPRLFMDDDRKLKVRARTFAEAEVFLMNFLNHTLENNQYGHFNELDLSSPVVHVGFNFDVVKLQQALVKIGLNCLIYYYSQYKNDPALDPYIGYVMNGFNGIRGGLESKDQLIDSVEHTHNVFFSQLEDNVRIRISLFNGQFVFAFWLENLSLLERNTHNRLLMDYQNRHNNFQDTTAFLKSFFTGSEAKRKLMKSKPIS